MPPLVVPTLNRSRAAGATALDERWVVARRLLHNLGIAASDRVAGALAVIYAQGLHRIARVKTGDVMTDEARVSVRLGGAIIILPEPLAAHMRNLILERATRPVKLKPAVDPGWLFRGVDPGRPITQSGLGDQLGRVGVQPGQHRLAALFQLAADLPAAIVSDLLGISTQTASNWGRLAGRSWSAYPDLRVVAVAHDRHGSDAETEDV